MDTVYYIRLLIAYTGNKLEVRTDYERLRQHVSRTVIYTRYDSYIDHTSRRQELLPTSRWSGRRGLNRPILKVSVNSQLIRMVVKLLSLLRDRREECITTSEE